MLHNESSYGAPPSQNRWLDLHHQIDIGCPWRSSQVEGVTQVQQEMKIHTNDPVNHDNDLIIYDDDPT